jgi:sec-independent protein translocase protein TatB
MFDVSFSELLVIAVVALLVIGPEKLPKIARTVGAFTGRMQRYVAQVKDEINREVRFEELQKLQQEIKQSVENTVESKSTDLRGSIQAVSGDAKKKTDVITRSAKSKNKAPTIKAQAAKTKTARPTTARPTTVKSK